jgi:plastocyanin
MTRPAVVALVVAALFMLSGCGSSGNKPAPTSQATTASSSSSSSSPGTSSTTTPAATLVEITVTGGHVVGGPKQVQVAVGKSITVRVTSDVAEEIHVHGYDLKQDLTPGVPAEISFTADIPGVFEVELEHSGLKVAELQVG